MGSEIYQNPAIEILANALVDTGIVELVGSWDKEEPKTKNGLWPIFIANVPNNPDSHVTILDTAALVQGRSMVTGRQCSNPGFQIRVQSHTYHFADYKSQQIYNELQETINETVVDLGENSYKIHTVVVDSPPLNLGRNVPESHRYAFTINGTFSLSNV